MPACLQTNHRSKVVKFAKNYRLDALIVLVRDEQFFFPFENDAKGGPLGEMSYFLAELNSKIKQVYLLATSCFALPFVKKKFR